MHYYYFFFCLARCTGSNIHQGFLQEESKDDNQKLRTEVLNSIENVKCIEVAGAMYAFPG